MGSPSPSPSNQDERRAQMLQELPRYVEGCFTDHKSTIFECTQRIRELLSFAKEAPIGAVVASGVIPRIIQFLRWTQCPELQFEAMWVLTNVCSANSNAEFTAKVVREGAIGAIVSIMGSSSHRLLEQAVWALGNIAGDSVELRNLVLDHSNLVDSMASLCSLRRSDRDSAAEFSSLVSLLRNVSWSLSNLCRYGGHNEGQWRALVQCLHSLLQQHEALEVDEEDASPEGLGTNIGWSFCYLTGDTAHERQTVELMETMNRRGTTKALVALLGSTNTFTVHSTLRAIGNMLTGSDRYTSHCIDCGVLPRLYALSQHFYAQSVNEQKLKEICWALSNITAGPLPHIMAVIEAQFVPVLVSILKESRTVIAAEALWAVSNATSNADGRVMAFLVDHDVIGAVCAFLKKKFEGGQHRYERSSEQLIVAALECIDNILSCDETDAFSLKTRAQFEEFGGIDFLEYLQSEERVSHHVYHHAVRLIATHWPPDDECDADLGDGDDSMAPAAGQTLYDGAAPTNGCIFGFGVQRNATAGSMKFEF